MEKLLSVCWIAGIIIFVAYQIIKRFVKIPDAVAYPVMIICIALMFVGLAYNGWCWGKGINPFDALKN